MTQQQNLSVLVVDRDDEATIQLKDILTTDGYQVATCSDATQAVEQIAANGYQLVVLDVSPGNEQGIDALQRIRAVDDDVCVIATTSHPSVDMAVTAMKHQAFHYLRKPLEAEEFRAVLKEAVRSKGLLVDLETQLNSEVGRRIREQRKGSSLTLKQLANRTGLSVSLISQIELGKSAASMSTLHKLATALQVRMTYFFETV